jgi:TRAP-type mannitol/chloroaromatic compound transport system substrate-binding protein
MPDLAAVAKAIQEADAAHGCTVYYKGSDGALRFVCDCGHEMLDRAEPRAHRYTAMARAAADALGGA